MSPPRNRRETMQREVEIEVDPQFNIHTSYHNDFFLLKTRVTANGENTQIKSVKGDSSEDPTLVYGSTISAKLSLITNTISPILHKFGVYHTDTFYYEQSPLFHVVFSSESCLKKFLLEIEMIKYAMQVALLSVFLESDSSHDLVIEVHPELFFVSPNRQKMKRADLHLVTTSNSSTFADHWKNSELFDFGSLYQEVGMCQVSGELHCIYDGSGWVSVQSIHFQCSSKDHTLFSLKNCRYYARMQNYCFGNN